MSKKNRSSGNDKIAAKKAAVLGEDKRKNPVPLVAMLACAVLVIGGAVFFLTRQGAGVPEATQTVASGTSGSEVSLPTAQFADGQGRFFEYRANGVQVRYFVMKSSDGVIRSAFDACDSCWRSGKGYRQEGDDMVCNNCGQHFPSVKVMVVKGGCNPAPLPNEVRGDKVVIRVQDIVAGRPYFDLKREG